MGVVAVGLAGAQVGEVLEAELLEFIGAGELDVVGLGRPGQL
jgi:hypothetical protein